MNRVEKSESNLIGHRNTGSLRQKITKIWTLPFFVGWRIGNLSIIKTLIFQIIETHNDPVIFYAVTYL